MHRWTGIFLCLFFAAWFASGAVMIYVPFPSLAEEARLAGSDPIDTTRIAVTPAAALAVSGAGPAARIRIVGIDGRSVYIIDKSNSQSVVIDAWNGEVLDARGKDAVRRIAEKFLGSPLSKVDGPLEYDQWIVHQGYDQYRPYYRAYAADKQATVLYVSAQTGEIWQKTTRRERLWNYLGAVVHWIYPTFIRKHWAVWDQLVWWLSLAGIAVAASGLWLGVKRMGVGYRAGSRVPVSPFRGWMRWHHLLGLGSGLFVLTWIFSGWLSMDHGRLFSSPVPAAERLQRFHGATVNGIAHAFTQESFAKAGSYRELELNAINGRPLLIARNPGQTDLYRVDKTGRLQAYNLTPQLLADAIALAWPKAAVMSVEPVLEYDVYTALREGKLPPTAYRVILDDAAATWVHVDSASARILSVMDRSRRLYRWLFNGLHALDFPVIVHRRPIWDVLMLFLLVAGLLFSVTALVIGTRRLLADWRSSE